MRRGGHRLARRATPRQDILRRTDLRAARRGVEEGKLQIVVAAGTSAAIGQLALVCEAGCLRRDCT